MMAFRVRTATINDVSDIARIHVESWRTAYVGIYSERVLAAFTVENRDVEWRHTLTDNSRIGFELVAEDDVRNVLGFISAGPERSGDPDYRGQVYAIHVAPDQKRGGIGQELMSAAAAQFLNDGIDSLLIWVLTDNHPARRFYEKLGGKLVRDQQITTAGQTVDEVAYGWEDVTSMID